VFKLNSYILVTSINLAIIIMIVISITASSIMLTLDSIMIEKLIEIAHYRFEEIILYGASEAPIEIEFKINDLINHPLEIRVNNSIITLTLVKGFTRKTVEIQLPSNIRFNYIGIIPPKCILNFTRNGNSILIEVIKNES